VLANPSIGANTPNFPIDKPSLNINHLGTGRGSAKQLSRPVLPYHPVS
jgi:hypothetical protein